MQFDPEKILHVLDRCCAAFTFPMLDNGYIYLAATRLSLFRSRTDWAMVIEVFGFSPRAGIPDTNISAFASTLHRRDAPENYGSREAYETYLLNNPNSDLRFFYPVEAGNWQDPDDAELVAQNATELLLRGQPVSLPPMAEYARYGVALAAPPRVQAFELCRVLAELARDQVLASTEERRVSVAPEMSQIMQLEEWHHPNVVEGERLSESETFQHLAQVLATGDVKWYQPSRPPNTHWSNWPEGGSL